MQLQRDHTHHATLSFPRESLARLVFCVVSMLLSFVCKINLFEKSCVTCSMTLCKRQRRLYRMTIHEICNCRTKHDKQMETKALHRNRSLVLSVMNVICKRILQKCPLPQRWIFLYRIDLSTRKQTKKQREAHHFLCKWKLHVFAPGKWFK